MKDEQFELILREEQRQLNAPTGSEVKKLLEADGVLSRGYAVDHPDVEYWKKNPGEYPAALRGRTAVMWGTEYPPTGEGKPGEVATITWVNKSVLVARRSLGMPFGQFYPALLRKA